MTNLAGHIPIIDCRLPGTVRNEILRVLDGATGAVKYRFCSRYAHIVVVLCYTIFATTSYHGNPTAAREVNLVEETIITSFVVGIASSLVAAWLYDRIRERGKH